MNLKVISLKVILEYVRYYEFGHQEADKETLLDLATNRNILIKAYEDFRFYTKSGTFLELGKKPSGAGFAACLSKNVKEVFIEHDDDIVATHNNLLFPEKDKTKFATREQLYDILSKKQSIDFGSTISPTSNKLDISSKFPNPQPWGKTVDTCLINGSHNSTPEEIIDDFIFCERFAVPWGIIYIDGYDPRKPEVKKTIDTIVQKCNYYPFLIALDGHLTVGPNKAQDYGLLAFTKNREYRRWITCPGFDDLKPIKMDKVDSNVSDMLNK